MREGVHITSGEPDYVLDQVIFPILYQQQDYNHNYYQPGVTRVVSAREVRRYTEQSYNFISRRAANNIKSWINLDEKFI